MESVGSKRTTRLLFRILIHKKEKIIMGITNKIFNKIKKVLFKEMKEDCLRMCFIFFTDDFNEDAVVVVPELIPAPPIELWPKLFNKVVDEVCNDMHRVPNYVSMVNIIKFSKQVHARPDPTKEDLNKELLRSATEGYFVIVAEVDSGDIECKLYKEDFSLEKGSTKKLNMFDVKNVNGFMPAIMMLNIITRFFWNGLEGDSDVSPLDNKTRIRQLGFKIRKNDDNSVEVDTVFSNYIEKENDGETKDEETNSDTISSVYKYNSN